MSDPLVRSTSTPLLAGRASESSQPASSSSTSASASASVSQPPPQQQQHQLPQQQQQISLLPAFTLPTLPSPEHTHICCVPSHTGMHPRHPLLQQPIYVLAPDGSQLYLVDPSRPPKNEEPPPYLPFREEGQVGDGRLESGPAGASGSGSGGRLPRPPSPRSPRRATSARNRAAVASAHSTVSLPAYLPAAADPEAEAGADERTPLLPHPASWRWREIVRGWNDTRTGVRGYFAPVGDTKHWQAVGHLAVVNFPFVSLEFVSVVGLTLPPEPPRLALPAGRHPRRDRAVDYFAPRRRRVVAYPPPRTVGRWAGAGDAGAIPWGCL
jgi:hypothetical protein